MKLKKAMSKSCLPTSGVSFVAKFGETSDTTQRLLRGRACLSERRRSIHPGWTGKARRTTISPAAQETATSDAEMSANLVDVGGRSDCRCRSRLFPGDVCQRLTTISDQP